MFLSYNIIFISIFNFRKLLPGLGLEPRFLDIIADMPTIIIG